MKIFVTGGHVTTAIAVVEQLSLERPDIAIVFIGRKYALEGTRHTSEEYRLVTDRAIRFLPLTTGRLQRVLTRWTLLSLLKLPGGFFQAFYYCWRENPALIVSFGGYIALPVVVAGWVLGIPSITHEQTKIPGMTNKIIAHIARRVCVSFEDTMSVFPKHKTIHTGLPIRKGIFRKPKSSSFPIDRTVPIVYITGGSTGAVSLNELVFPVVTTLIRQFTVVHQTGPLSYEKAQILAAKLSGRGVLRYIPRPYIDETDQAFLLHRATLVIGRSGANTVGEVHACGAVGLFVPLPWSSNNEQLHNAMYLANLGAAVVLEQQTLSPRQLLESITWFTKNIEPYQRQARLASQMVIRDGAKRVVREIVNLLS